MTSCEWYIVMTLHNRGNYYRGRIEIKSKYRFCNLNNTKVTGSRNKAMCEKTAACFIVRFIFVVTNLLHREKVEQIVSACQNSHCSGRTVDLLINNLYLCCCTSSEVKIKADPLENHEDVKKWNLVECILLLSLLFVLDFLCFGINNRIKMFQKQGLVCLPMCCKLDHRHNTVARYQDQTPWDNFQYI